jgi:hypothetical protein
LTKSASGSACWLPAPWRADAIGAAPGQRARGTAAGPGGAPRPQAGLPAPGWGTTKPANGPASFLAAGGQGVVPCNDVLPWRTPCLGRCGCAPGAWPQIHAGMSCVPAWVWLPGAPACVLTSALLSPVRCTDRAAELWAGAVGAPSWAAGRARIRARVQGRGM